MSDINILPNVAFGARFWSYHIKPEDDEAYFVSNTNLSAAPGQDLWAGVDPLWIAPTQLLIVLDTSAEVDDRVLSVEIVGVDQFGYPVDEVVTLKSMKSTYSRVGTAKCHTNVSSMIVTVADNISGGVGIDQYRIGIGRSSNDDNGSSPPDPFRPDDSYRIPLPARVRDASQVKGVQDVLLKTFYLPEDASSPPPSYLLTIDLENQALEVELSTDDERRLAVILDPNSASI